MDEPYRGHPTFERGLELLGFDPFERLDEGTRFQQPAIFLCSVAAWELWCAEQPEEAAQVRAAAGHSLGEYAALVAAGVLRFEDAIGLVAERAAAMADAGEGIEAEQIDRAVQARVVAQPVVHSGFVAALSGKEDGEVGHVRAIQHRNPDMGTPVRRSRAECRAGSFRPCSPTAKPARP
jgi:hypothetical protein